MRDLTEVIKQIKELVPADFEKREPLFNDLDYAANQICYAPPEMWANCWLITAEALATYIGDPKEPWQHQVRDLFNGLRKPKV